MGPVEFQLSEERKQKLIRLQFGLGQHSGTATLSPDECPSMKGGYLNTKRERGSLYSWDGGLVNGVHYLLSFLSPSLPSFLPLS